MAMTVQRQQAAGRREQVLQVLRNAGTSMSIVEIAERLAIHVNTVRFHLDTLVSNGQVERATAELRTPGRPPQLFQAVRGMDPMGPRHYRALAGALVASLAAQPDPGRRGVEAGRVWGSQQVASDPDVIEGVPVDAAESVGRLVEMLDEMGFAPEASEPADPLQVGLRNCPFLELAVDRPDVVCPVHLGLMQGAMQTWGAPVTVDRLDAFVEPDLCMVHLSHIGVS